jgi:hypothetical protein
MMLNCQFRFLKGRPSRLTAAGITRKAQAEKIYSRDMGNDAYAGSWRMKLSRQ